MNKHDKQVLADAIRSQKEERLTKASMISAIQGMMQGFGIPAIEFADENGKVRGRINVPKPKDVPCKVPAYGGGMVTIKQGDRVRVWHRDEYTVKWTEIGVGKVLCVRPAKHTEGHWEFAYQRENAGPKEGASSCHLACPPMGWAHVVEKIS